MNRELLERIGKSIVTTVLLLIMAHSAIPAAQATACEESPAIDLTLEEPLLSMKPFYQSGNPVTGVPGRPAGAQDTGLCFAIAASQMADIIRWKYETRNAPGGPSSPVAGPAVAQTSPLYAAAQYPAVLAEKLLTQARLGSAFITESCRVELQKLASNPRHPVPSCLSEHHKTELFMNGGSSCPLIDRLMVQQSCEISDTWLIDSGSAYELQNALLFSEILPAADRYPDQLLGPGATCDPYDQTGGVSFRDAEIRSAILRSCTNPVKPQGLHAVGCKTRRFSTSGSAWSTIATQLQKSYPISIGVCLNLFKQKSSEPGAVTLSNGQISPAPGCLQHALLVVGRRWNKSTGACEYKLRDSYPRGRDPLHPTDIWVSEALLAKNIYAVDEVSGLP